MSVQISQVWTVQEGRGKRTTQARGSHLAFLIRNSALFQHPVRAPNWLSPAPLPLQPVKLQGRRPFQGWGHHFRSVGLAAPMVPGRERGLQSRRFVGNSTSGRSFRVPWGPCNYGPGPGPFSPPSPALGENKGRGCREPSEPIFPRGFSGSCTPVPFHKLFSQPWFPFLVSSSLSRPNFQVLPRVRNLPQLFQAEAAWNHPAKLTVTSSTRDGLVRLFLPQRRRAQNLEHLRCSVQAGETCGVLPSPPAGVAHAH